MVINSTRNMRKKHTDPVDIMRLSVVAIDPIQNVKCTVCSGQINKREKNFTSHKIILSLV